MSRLCARHGARRMALGRSHPGEPGIGDTLGPPFVAGDEPTRWLFSLNRFGIRPGLSRVQGLLADMGHPERNLRTIVTAGTNGKGSTTRILARLLQDAGHRVVSYTSPHLLNVHERIEINDTPVDPLDFAARVEAIRPLTEKHEASWFETLTAIAVKIASDEGADYFCCETGLGGRLDATNALPSIANLLTTVSLDHQKILGSSLPEIAAEKLGLLKRDVPLFTGVDDELRSQTFMAAVTAGSQCFFLDELARWPNSEGQTWDLTLRKTIHQDLPDFGTVAMQRNVALAVLALTELSASRGESMLPDDPSASLRNLFLPGRYHRVFRDPDWIFDTAHNAQALIHVLSTFLAATKDKPSGRNIVIYGAMEDKGTPAELAPLFDQCDHLVGVPVTLPRSCTPDELRSRFVELGQAPGAPPDLWKNRCTVFDELSLALQAVATGATIDDRVLVTGSCFMVAETLHKLGIEKLSDAREVRPASSALAQIQIRSEG
ncbi:MAG: dihydrofolate synthase/folylpolyglutamate synthase [Candidatus Krumholzibacteriia bacterium]|jgi:dihydrofolate synthase/folylpolyglutamate synthase